VNRNEVDGWNDTQVPLCDAPTGPMLNQQSLTVAPTTAWRFFELSTYTIANTMGQLEIRVTNTLTVSCPDPGGSCRTAAGIDYTRVRGV
jgi:hypothetical protein